MPIDLNMDMGTVIKDLISKCRNSNASGQTSSNVNGKLPIAAYKVAIIISILMILVIITYITFIYLPLKEKNHQKADELNKILEMKTQLSVLDEQIDTLKKRLDKSKEEYIESLSNFGSSDDLGSLYQVVSTLAAKYNLVVLNVKEIALPPPPPPAAKTTVTETPGANAEKKDDKVASATPAAPAAKAAGVSVKESRVELELKGHYGEYIKFKEDLAIAAALLKINSESIIVKNETTEQGSIYVKLNLSTYAIDKKPFQGIITDKENEKTQ